MPPAATMRAFEPSPLQIGTKIYIYIYIYTMLIHRQVKAMAPARTEVDNLARDVDDLREGVSELRGKVDQLLERKIEWPDHP